MKIFKPLFFIAIAFGCLAACEKNEEPINNIVDKFGEIISLKIGESAEIEGAAFVVAFDNIVDDSRCPTGTSCFWEGQAEISLLVNETQIVEVIMRSGKEELAKDTLEGFVYTLLDVTPYPDSKETLPIPSESYSIDIQVDKL